MDLAMKITNPLNNWSKRGIIRSILTVFSIKLASLPYALDSQRN